MLGLTGCGYIGDPLPPSLNIPDRVSNLTVLQRGDKLIFDFTIPELTTDGIVLKNISGVDLRGGPGGAPFNMTAWVAGSKPIPVEADEAGPVHQQAPAREWIGQNLVFFVRVAGPKGRFSEWSNGQSLRITPPLPQPYDVKAEAVAAGVRVSWQPQSTELGVTYRVYRRDESPGGTPATEPSATLLDSVAGHEFIDRSAVFGKPYIYTVLASANSGGSQNESEISAPVSITPIDTFPPAVPAGVTAVAAPESIELSWERNTEADLRGYRVYRSVDGRPFDKVSDLIDTPSFSDRKIQSGMRYQYSVLSIDVSGNESSRSSPVEVTAP